MNKYKLLLLLNLYLQAVSIAVRPELKQIKNHNRTLSLNDLTFRNDENSPCNINENNLNKEITLKTNADLVKIGDVYHRQNNPRKDEKISTNNYIRPENPTRDSDYPLEKCEIEVKNNPLYVTEYSREIFEHLQNTENINSARHGYFQSGLQKNINEKMRTILVDWIIDVHFKFKLVPETLYLTVNIIDSYLSKAQIENTKFQLLGVSAMLIAAKYEEIYAPEVRDFVYITDKCCLHEDILAMESKILTVLNFDILWTSPLRFLERFHFISSSNSNSNSSDNAAKCFYLAQYLLEISLLEYKMLSYPPSLRAASALYISRKILKIDGPGSWTNSLQFHTNYKEKELINCAKDLCSMLELISNLSIKACFKKFSTPKFLEVSSFVSQRLKGMQEKNKK